MRILYIAYPLAPVSAESCGGAEQIVFMVEREFHHRGHETTLAACKGSRASGELLETGACGDMDSLPRRDPEHSDHILEFLSRTQNTSARFDLVHDHSATFWKHAGQVDAPVLATLHLPQGFYPQEMFARLAPNLFFNCVSHSQAQSFSGLPQMAGVTPNGIVIENFPLHAGKENYLLWLGRICEEKGAHIAIEVAAMAGLPLLIAGTVYPFSYHHQYFLRELAPRIAASVSGVRFVQGPTLAEKVELLQRARAVLIPSLVAETSSLVAMEAMACGTPPIAFRRGALSEVIADGETGFVVDTPEQMATAIRRVHEISPERCRARVEENFAATRMADDYERLYGRVLAAHRERPHEPALA